MTDDSSSALTDSLMSRYVKSSIFASSSAAWKPFLMSITGAPDPSSAGYRRLPFGA